MPLDSVPVLLQVAARVAHGVSVLAHDKRPVVTCGLRPVHNGVDRGVHGADDVAAVVTGVPPAVHGAFVVKGPRRVSSAYPSRHGIVVRSVARLVAQ